jgi:hypothetical protein
MKKTKKKREREEQEGEKEWEMVQAHLLGNTHRESIIREGVGSK